VPDKVAIGLEEEEQAAVSKRVADQNDRHHGSLHQCFVPQWVCLRKKEHCGKGDAQ